MQFDRLKRREFITLLGGAAVAWPLVARAQLPAIPVIGLLSTRSPAQTINLAGFRRGLKEAGYVEGQNLAMVHRGANGQIERLPAMAADLVRDQVAVIVATGGASSALAAKAATSTIPIVLIIGPDPVKYGLVASLNRPGGNVTGVTSLTQKLTAKRLDLLRELVPQATTIAYLTEDARHPSYEDQKSDVLEAARALGQEVIVLEVRSERDFEAAFAAIVDRRAGALIVGTFPIIAAHSNMILALAAQHNIPAIYYSPEIVRGGGLMSYSADGPDGSRQAGVYVGRILKGAVPADLPVLQPTKFDLVINLKTAKTLRLTVPPSLLVIADEVIE
jgi:putative ABC transport system substrate-binding protein